MENTYTVFNKFSKIRYPIYTFKNGLFGIPLYKDPTLIQNSDARDLRTPGGKVNFNFTGIYREGQERVIAKFHEQLLKGKTGFILEAKPGSGKTVCGISMMQLLGTTTLIVVPRSNLIKQWYDRLLEHTDLPKSSIGIIEGSKRVWEGKKVVVGLVHSLNSSKRLPWFISFRKYFGLLLFDEVHSSVPPVTFSSIVTLFPSRYRIGMSATLNRDDGMDAIFRWHIGQVYLKLETTARMLPKVVVVTYKGFSGFVPMSSNLLNRRGMLISKLAANYKRNKLLAHLILKLYLSGRKVCVLSDRVAQLKILRELVSTEIDAVKIGLYIRGKTGLSSSSRKKIETEAMLILATYQMFDLGTDVPDLAGLVYGTPQKNVAQKQGRVERICAAKKQPIVIDIVDSYYADALRWASCREKFYRREKLEISQITI